MGIATIFSDFVSQVVYRLVDIIGSEIPHCIQNTFKQGTSNIELCLQLLGELL